MRAAPWLLAALFGLLWWRARHPSKAGRAAWRSAAPAPAPPSTQPHHSGLDIEPADPADERLVSRRRWVWFGAAALLAFTLVMVLASRHNDISITPLPNAQSGQSAPDGPAELLALQGGQPGRAPALFRSYGCGSCHVVPGVSGAVGRVGPNLAHLHDHALIAGVLPNTPENVVRWIRVPQNVDPYTGMPNLGVTEQDARDLAAYLQALR